MFEFNECSIIFRPVCQHCGAIIESPVSINDSYECMMKNGLWIKNYQITPNRCPNCGCTFTSIIGPKNLCDAPYDISDLIECDARTDFTARQR